MTERRKRILSTVELPEALRERLRAQSARYHITVSDIITAGTAEMVDRLEKATPVLPE